MNEDKTKFRQRGDDIRLDLLVDGELPENDYRALLAALDEQPGGWRRCALAFLEAQALRHDVAGLRQSMNLGLPDRPDEPPGMKSTGPAPHSPQRDLRGASSVAWKSIAIAASFLAAFLLGIWGPKWLQTQTAKVGRPVMDAALAQPGSTGIVDWQFDPRPGAGLGQRQQTARPVGNVQLVVDRGSGAAKTGSLPVYDAPHDVESWLSEERSGLSPQVIQELQNRGHRVLRQTQYIPMQLEDGRQIIVPVEGYQIAPSAGPMY
jgi:hypothetical protein